MKIALVSHSNDAPVCSVERTGTGYLLKLGESSLVVDGTLFRASEMQYVYVKRGELVLVSQAAYVDARDWQAVMRQMELEKQVASVYFGATPDEAVLVVHVSCATDIEDFVEVTLATPGEMAAEVYPSASAVRRRNAAKMDLVRDVNPLDSLSSLEKQVDLLTDMVLQLTALVPAGQSIPLAGKLQQLLAECGANEGRSADDVVDSIGDFKKALRDRQLAYFAKRSGSA
jgi:hypothetical protein